MFKTIQKQAESIIVEKKSKFIANVYEVQNVDEAEDIIEKIKRKYHDARHNTYAYRILKGNVVLEKQSDDGEPSGTAGAPILNILSKKGITNVLVIVTRYFGGILLGTGGLVKAYSDATQKALEEAREIEKEKGYLAEAIIEYEKQKDFEYFCEKNNINIVLKKYEEKVKNLIEISQEKYVEIFQENEKKNFHKFTVVLKKEKYIEKTI